MIFVKLLFTLFILYGWVGAIEKGIRIEYPYNYGLPHGNSAFVTIWLEFDLLVRTIVQI